MKVLLMCRRTIVALVSIAGLIAVALVNHVDVSMAVATIAVGIAGANATEAAFRSKFEQPKTED